MNKLYKGIVRLDSDEQFQELMAVGSVTLASGELVRYSPDDTTYYTRGNKYVSYKVQQLEEAEKKQARANIGITDIDTSKFVTTDTEQTITGVKTFDSNILFSTNQLCLKHATTQNNAYVIIGNYNKSNLTNLDNNIFVGNNQFAPSGGNGNILIGQNVFTEVNANDNIILGSGHNNGVYGISIGYKSGISAIGFNSKGNYGIGIGFNANYIAANAIQLGTGTNSKEKTLQIYDYQLLDGNTGKIPAERIPDALTNGQIKTVSYDNTTLADHITEILGHVNIENGGTLLKIGFKLGSASVEANSTKATIASGANPTVASASVAAFKASGFYSFTASDIMTEAGVTTLTLNGPNGLDGTSSSNIEITSNTDNTTQTCAANGTSTAINADGNVEITSFKAVNLLTIPLEHLTIDYFTI